MRQASSRISKLLLYAYCVLALVISCGVPEALHELGHTLTRTNCEAPTSLSVSLGISATRSTKISSARLINQIAAGDACWIQSFVSSLTQHSVRAATTTAQAPPLVTASDFTLPAKLAVSSRDQTYWHSSRGPPTA